MAKTPAARAAEVKAPAAKPPAKTPPTKSPAKLPAANIPAKLPAAKAPAKTPPAKSPAKLPAAKLPAKATVVKIREPEIKVVDTATTKTTPPAAERPKMPAKAVAEPSMKQLFTSTLISAWSWDYFASPPSNSLKVCYAMIC
jgi:hypothetical protein